MYRSGLFQQTSWDLLKRLTADILTSNDSYETNAHLRSTLLLCHVTHDQKQCLFFFKKKQNKLKEWYDLNPSGLIKKKKSLAYFVVKHVCLDYLPDGKT